MPVCHPWITVHVCEARLPRETAHVGSARRAALDLAAKRFLLSGKQRGIVATTDADTVVAPDWVAWTLAEMRAADAVAGHVVIAEAELATLHTPLRHLYDLQQEYLKACADVQAHFDPLPENPGPRHDSFVGASFAVAAEVYAAAGGLPIVSPLEDRAFFFSLRRIDARVRHSYRVRAATSARRTPRVVGGFGSFLDRLDRYGRAGRTFLVEHPDQTIDDARRRATLRRIWHGHTSHHELEVASELLGMPASAWLLRIDREQPFGTNLERLVAQAPKRTYVPQAVEFATAELRRALADDTAVSAMRRSAASGAG